MEILISDSAFGDLESIKEYYSEQNVLNIGQEFVVSNFEHIQTLLDYPSIGRIVPEFNEEHIREIIHLPFRIVYLRGATSIQIIRVWRSSERLLVLPEGET